MALFFWLLSGCTGLLYIIWIACLCYGFRKQLHKPAHSYRKDSPIFTTVVIPARNEEHHIGRLLDSLNWQTVDHANFEVIIVDDHSEDGTAQVVADFAAKHPELNLLMIDAGDNTESPKKKAIEAAVGIAKGDLLITMDADGTVGPAWLGGMVSVFQHESVELAAGPVRMKPVRGAFEYMQAFEFLSLIGSGMAMAGLGEHILANGANLAFTRNAYQMSASATPLHKRASGDDIQMLMAVKKQHRGAIRFISDPNCFVNTRPQRSLWEFFQQRKRWASKAKSGYDAWNSVISLWVFFFNFLLIALPVAGFFVPECFLAALWLFVVRFLADIPFLYAVAGFARQRKLFWVYLPLQLLYPWYILFTALAGVYGTYRWKGRKFSKQ